MLARDMRVIALNSIDKAENFRAMTISKTMVIEKELKEN